MKLLKLCWLPVLLMAMFLGGCSQSNEDEVRKAKRFEALKGLPLDTVLTRAYKFYEQFQATGDTLLRDSMDDYRNHFFARWKLSTDSICATVPADDSLAAELRDIYEVVMEFYTKQAYWRTLEDAQRDSLLVRADRDSTRAIREKKDSIENMVIMDISIEEAVSGLRENPNSMYESAYNSAYFVQSIWAVYLDTSVSSMKDMDKIEWYSVKRDEWKKTNVACLSKTPAGQQVLVINKEYGTLLNDFMKTNIHVSRKERYSKKFLLGKSPFWYPIISVVPHHWGDGFHFDSFPSILQAVFNKTHDMVMLNVMESFSSGDYYYFSKSNGKWKFVKYRYGWMM